MLRGAAAFYIVAIIASVLDFGGAAVTAGIAAKILFFGFLARFLFMLVRALFVQRRLPLIREVASGAGRTSTSSRRKLPGVAASPRPPTIR
jgi:uncharacterized membrane protein YtjA (UPF0391 family)